MQWLRGKDDTATAMVSAGLAEIDGLFRPSRHKQTEHVEESKRRKVDVANGTGIDLEKGVAVIRTPKSGPAEPDPTDPAGSGGPTGTLESAETTRSADR